MRVPNSVSGGVRHVNAKQGQIAKCTPAVRPGRARRTDEGRVSHVTKPRSPAHRRRDGVRGSAVSGLVRRQKEVFDALTTTHSLYSVPLVLPKYGVVASAGWDAPALTFRLLTLAVAGTAVEVASPRNFIVMLYV